MLHNLQWVSDFDPPFSSRHVISRAAHKRVDLSYFRLKFRAFGGPSGRGASGPWWRANRVGRKQAGKLGEGAAGMGKAGLPAGARSEFLWVRGGGAWLGSRARVRGMVLFLPGRGTTRGWVPGARVRERYLCRRDEGTWVGFRARARDVFMRDRRRDLVSLYIGPSGTGRSPGRSAPG